VDSYLAFKGRRKKAELAFYGGNFLGLPYEAIQRFLICGRDLVARGKIDGIRFSTRPDTITEKTIELIRSCPVSTVEIGAQSMNDKVLEISFRGHGAQDTVNAAELLKKSGIRTGLQMMVGLMGDTADTARHSASAMAGLAPDFVRIYPLLVLKSSRMAAWYHDKKYEPLSLESAVELVADLYQIFSAKRIPVIRMGLQASQVLSAPDTILAGPWHPAFGHLVYSRLFYKKACRLIDDLTAEPYFIQMVLHPSSESRMRGNRNENMKKLKERYPLCRFEIKKDVSKRPDELAVEV
jgi:histone acetyltransferase (RNA polymerase elongator complex component)